MGVESDLDPQTVTLQDSRLRCSCGANADRGRYRKRAKGFRFGIALSKRWDATVRGVWPVVCDAHFSAQTGTAAR